MTGEAFSFAFFRLLRCEVYDTSVRCQAADWAKGSGGMTLYVSQ
jgi:hypothetical protein